MVQQSSAATQTGSSGRLWRQYWLLTVPVLASTHASFLLGALLLARAIGGGGGGAVGGLSAWFLINAWRARPGAEDKPDSRTYGRCHVAGVVSVQREGLPGTARSSPPEPAPVDQPALGSTSRRRGDIFSIVLALLLLAVDIVVVIVLLSTAVWASWVSVLAVLLLAVHSWLAYRALSVEQGRSARRSH